MLKELNIEKVSLLLYIGKGVMCVTFEGKFLPSYEDAIKIIVLTEETCALKRELKKIGGCANYMQDKGYNQTTLGICFSFVSVNHLPNCRAHGDHIVKFEPFKCYYFKQSDAIYTR